MGGGSDFSFFSCIGRCLLTKSVFFPEGSCSRQEHASKSARLRRFFEQSGKAWCTIKQAKHERLLALGAPDIRGIGPRYDLDDLLMRAAGEGLRERQDIYDDTNMHWLGRCAGLGWAGRGFVSLFGFEGAVEGGGRRTPDDGQTESRIPNRACRFGLFCFLVRASSESRSSFLCLGSFPGGRSPGVSGEQK